MDVSDANSCYIFNEKGNKGIRMGQTKKIFNNKKKKIQIKQWPLAPNLPKWRITRANVSRQVTFLLNTCQICRSECIESELSRVANLANFANF
jgi:hypothetical protein